MRQTFSLLFWLKRAKLNKKGEAHIYIRITVNGKRAELSTHIAVKSEAWHITKGRVKGQSEMVRAINVKLDKMSFRLNQIYDKMSEREGVISAKLIKNAYLGVEEKRITLISLFQEYLVRMEKQIGITYKKNTVLQSRGCFNHLKNFLKEVYGLEDISLKDLTHQFIVDFDYYLRTEKKVTHNTSVKNLIKMRQVVRIAVDNDLLEKDPFIKFKAHKEKTSRGFLSKEELFRIENRDLSDTLLEIPADLFLFSCYTGISFSDLLSLTPDNIVIGIDSSKWLVGERTKTATPYNVPILPKAELLLEKYKNHPKVEGSSKLFPSISNAQINQYLKEIASLSGITKHLTFHMARHTFATTITLTNGVSIESVSAMLGHSDIQTTQIYAKVLKTKVSEDMTLLKRRLNNEENKKKEDLNRNDHL